jgi:Tol biopolymer transport system component
MPARIAALFVLVLVAAPGARAFESQVPDSIVFERNGDLYRMTVDGSETVRLTTTKAEEHSPAVSPDRLQIAFVRSNDELWVMTTQGGDERRLLARRPHSVRYASTGSPSWSPGGRTLFLDRVSQTPNEICGSIYRVGSRGENLKRVTAGVVKGWLDANPSISSDGRRIVFTSGDCLPGFGREIGVVDPAGRRTRDLRKLKPTMGIQIEPTWAPDGGRIAFVVYDVDGSGRSAVHIVNRDGSGLRRITGWTFETGAPAWSPDGEWVAFHKEGGVHLIRPDGSGLQRVPGTRGKDSSPAWLPRS